MSHFDHVEHRPDAPQRLGGLSARERQFLSAFVASESAAVTVDDVVALEPMARPLANQMLTRLTRKGWLRRVRRGIYTTVPLASSNAQASIEDAWPLAMKLFSPCFISGWSAAEHWDLTEQIFNTIAVVTKRPQRKANHQLGGLAFRTRTVPDAHFFGAKMLWFGSQRIAIADPHRLVVDILDDLSFGGGGRQAVDIVRAYWKSEHADADMLLGYAKRFARGSVFKRLGFTAEKYGRVDELWMQACRDNMSGGISNLDPASPHRGPVAARWRLRVNMPVDDS